MMSVSIGNNTHPSCNSTYQLDSASPSVYTSPFLIASTIWNQRYYQSSQLEDGEHTLIISASCGAGTQWYWLDYITYVPSALESTASLVQPAPEQSPPFHASPIPHNISWASSASTESTSTTAISGLAQLLPTSSTTYPTQSLSTGGLIPSRGSQGLPLAAIAAPAIIGGIILLYLCFLRRLRRYQSQSSSEQSFMHDEGQGNSYSHYRLLTCSTTRAPRIRTVSTHQNINTRSVPPPRDVRGTAQSLRGHRCSP